MNNKYDILLISPPLIWGQKERMDIKPPLNLMYLSSYLNTRGVKCKIIDSLSEKYDTEEILTIIEEKTPEFIGIPFYHASIDTVMYLSKKIKERWPSIKIIGGGPSMTIHAGELLRYEEIDFGVKGEGEITLEQIIKEKDYENIDGLVYKKNGSVITNNVREHVDLDSLPYIDYSLVNMNPYFDYQDSLKIPRSIFMTTSRGCGFKCIYCATPMLWPGKIRRYSPRRVIDEIKYTVSKFPGVNIGFMDDSFFASKKWLQEFCSNISGVRYCCIGRADHLEKELIELLAKTGCHYVALGVETGNPFMQKKIKKHLNLEKTKKNVKLLVDNNILTKCFFMLGFPEETVEEMSETINFAVDLRKAGMFKFNFFPVVIYPGTELANGRKEETFKSRIYEDYKLDNTEDFGEKCIRMYSTIPDADINQYLTGEELIELTKLAYNKVESMEYITPGEIMSYVKKR